MTWPAALVHVAVTAGVVVLGWHHVLSSEVSAGIFFVMLGVHAPQLQRRP
jgi:hypothetical protein